MIDHCQTDGPCVHIRVDGDTYEITSDNQTETIIEEFIQSKVRTEGKVVRLRSEPLDRETDSLVKRLLDISNELEERYGEQLNSDAQQWIQSATFDKFVQIGKGLFINGEITWARIVVLFMFAVKVVLNAVRENLSDLARNIISYVLKFFLIHGVHKWIQANGGWRGILAEYGSGLTGSGFLAFSALLLTALYLVLRNS